MIELLVGMACFFTFFSLAPGVGPAMQAAAVLLQFGAAAYAVLLNRVKPIPASATELVMYVVGVAYIVLGMLRQEDALEAMVISVAFMSTLIFISIISRAISLERLLDIGAVVALLCVLTAIAVDHQKAFAALVPRAGSIGLDRFMPLGATPALVGYIFGAGSILMFRRVIVSSDIRQRLLMAGGALFAFLFVLAASARSSLVALVAAALVALTLEFGLRRVLSLRWVKIAGVSFIAFGIAFADKISSYFTRMLDLESSTRGIGTGATGRTELWARGITTLFDSPVAFVFGDGFRSSNSGVIGFSTESSYISILLDSGAFLGIAVILVFLYSPIKALSLVPRQNRPSSSLVLLAPFLTFLLVESIFSRYLLGIGNPTSLLTLMLLFSLSMRERANNAVQSPWPRAVIAPKEAK
jgi:exopolysaccharide production protein ExoQ